MSRASFLSIGGATVVAIGVTASIAYAALPERAVHSRLAGAAQTHEVLGPQVYNAAPRKFVFAFCPRGEDVTGGGHILAGAFQTVGAPAPKALPIVTESHVVNREGTGQFGWEIVAVAPSSFKGKWAVQARAVCE